MDLWIVGKHVRQHGPLEHSWEFIGVFDSEEKAVAACKDESHFIGPAVLNCSVQEETLAWPGAYYPKVQVDEVIA